MIPSNIDSEFFAPKPNKNRVEVKQNFLAFEKCYHNRENAYTKKQRKKIEKRINQLRHLLIESVWEKL